MGGGGGEIMAQSNQPVDVAVAAGDEPLSRRFGFRLVRVPDWGGDEFGPF